MTRRFNTSESGQLVVGVMLLLVLMSIMVPLMVMYTQREAKWTAKQDQSTTAFHLAEAGVEKAYRALSLSTATWYALTEDGTPVPNFNFDQEFEDLAHGSYTVAIASGPKDRQATVYSIGKDKRRGEVRALKVIFGQNILGDIAIQALSGINVLGGVTVEWGAIIGGDHIDTGGATFPQFHSATSLDIDTDPNPPNCDSPDCCQWFSFSPDIPPDPGIDLNFYRSSAAAGSCSITGSVNDDPVGSCYFSSNQNWESGVSYDEGGTIFIEGNLHVKKDFGVTGSVIVTGNFTTAAGNWGANSVDMIVPQSAWKQYCNNWTHYRSEFDGAAPAVFPGLDDDYESDINLNYATTPGGKTGVQGFLYIGGTLSTSGGGGNTVIHGILFAEGTVTIAANSGVTVYYNTVAAEGVRSTRLVLVRKDWRAILHPWPL